MKRNDGLTKEERNFLRSPFEANADSAMYRKPLPLIGKTAKLGPDGQVMYYDKRLGWYNADAIDPDAYVDDRKVAKRLAKKSSKK